MNFQDYEAVDFACDESFQRYCLEEDDAAILFWEDWISQYPGKKAVIQEARHMVELLSAKQGNRLEQLRHLKDGIAQYDLLQHALVAAPENETISLRRVLPYAAILAGIVLLATTAYLFYQKQLPHSADRMLISAGNELRKTVVLPDGSSIILRKNSTVELAAGFNQVNRDLTLTGEAFFDVTHDAQHPFMVHTALVDIKVLGTVFNVSAYTGNGQMETALFKGKVEVAWKAMPERKITLQPNQKLIINAATVQAPTAAGAQTYKVMPLDADPVDHKAKEIAWVRNRLEIENEPLVEIAAKLEKWYGIPVTFADDEVKNYRYSGTFESETIMKALDALQLSYPFSFRMVNGVIIISK
ncbi:FecR family protein [Chitinophaga niastensis]|uniref:FecR family protein n=1 Tax=Chitinophaga niastensis TaxID=536980 RepID=A0A2P8HMT8_CHINA|nr:FecR domain-containing protein [Chitinophaga niastensis]PSL47520.1 FecR family protein [Chitinophaga niastensis]